MKIGISQKLSALIGLAFIIGIAANSSLGCLTPGSLVGSFDPDNYVFIGKVTAYTANTDLPGRQHLIRGLEVQPTDNIFPAKLPSQVIVFPLRRMADCDRGGMSKPELEREYPIGSEIKVIARRASDIKYPATKELVLEAGFIDHTFVALNPKEGVDGRNTLDEEFDYSKANESFLSSPPARYYFVAFEIQKDLARLERSSPSDRRAILDRVRYAPNYARIEFSLVEARYNQPAPDLRPL